MKFLRKLFFFNCPLCHSEVFRLGPVLLRYKRVGNETPIEMRVCMNCFSRYGGFR